MTPIELTPGGIATLACMLEISAPKPGNVHRGADFEDVTFMDFATSAVILGEVIHSKARQPLGETVLATVERNSQAVGTNTNLGIVLLIVPLAKVAADPAIGKLTVKALREYLKGLTPEDGGNVYAAIRLAQPGGLGSSSKMDVHSEFKDGVDLISAMELTADRDAIARQYTTGFVDVFECGLPLIDKGQKVFGNLSQAIVYAHVALMAREGDSLIARKCGMDVAEHSKFLAAKAVECLDIIGESDRAISDKVNSEEALESFWAAVGELDFWLRSDGHRRNPGTTADLIAASLFVGIHNGTIQPPFR